MFKGNLLKNSFTKLSKSLKNTNFNILSIPKFNFASTTTLGEEEVVFETREEKDLRYEDELFYFEKEWKRLEEDKIKKHQDYISTHMSDHQQREADILLERIKQMSVIERRYFELCLKKEFDLVSGVDLGKPNVFYTDKNPKIVISHKEDNPNWEKTQEILNVLAPFIASGYFTGSAVAAPTGQQEKVSQGTAETKTEKAAEKKEEKLKVKYDIKLSSFDAAKKIALIKEVRTIFNLGLKEAKEIVDKAPISLKKDVLRDEAEDIQKKLQEQGGVVELL